MAVKAAAAGPRQVHTKRKNRQHSRQQHHEHSTRLLGHGPHQIPRHQLQPRQRAQQRRVLLVERVHELGGPQAAVCLHPRPLRRVLLLLRWRLLLGLRRRALLRRRRRGSGGRRGAVAAGLLPRPGAAGCVLIRLHNGAHAYGAASNRT